MPSGPVGAQVCAPLTWLAHTLGQFIERLLVEHPRFDHHAFVRQRAAVSGH